jgi:hypothetical protein
MGSPKRLDARVGWAMAARAGRRWATAAGVGRCWAMAGSDGWSRAVVTVRPGDGGQAAHKCKVAACGTNVKWRHNPNTKGEKKSRNFQIRLYSSVSRTIPVSHAPLIFIGETTSVTNICHVYLSVT